MSSPTDIQEAPPHEAPTEAPPSDVDQPRATPPPPGAFRPQPPGPARPRQAPPQSPATATAAPPTAVAPERIAPSQDQPAPAAEAPLPPPSPPVATAETIESLDAELANVADSLLGSETAIEPEPVPRSYTPAMPAVAALQPEAYRPKAQEPQEPEVPKNEPVALPEVSAAAPVVTPSAPGDLLNRARSRIGDQGEQALYNLLLKASAPLNKQSPSVRTAVGLIAAANFFLALCVWMYVLFLRPADAPPPRAPTAAKQMAETSAKPAPAKKADSGKSAKGGN